MLQQFTSRRMTRRAALLGSLGAALTLSSCATVTSKQDDWEGTITFSLTLGDGSHQHQGGVAFAEKLAELTDGRIKVKFYFNNALGGEREVVEGMSINAIKMGIASTGPMGGFVRSFMLFDMPYLFESTDHAYSVLDGEIGDELAAEFLEITNVRILGWQENGFRYLTNSQHPIVTPADLEGIKHRTQESAAQLDTWNALGANAMPMAWPEVYTGLQQGVIDSQENPIATIVDMNFAEVQDHVSLTQHVYSPAPLMISETFFQTFSEQDQQAILEAGTHATAIQRQVSYEMEQEGLTILAEDGMEIAEIERDAFVEKTRPVLEAWQSEIPRDLIQRTLDAAPTAQDEGGDQA
jgi:TRAP-type transport system periplasmic protein